MASILKVDTVQGATTATTVAMPSNTHIPGAVVQVQFVNSTSGSALSANTSATGHTLLTKAITTKIANSQIFIQCQLCHGVGGTDANMDSHDTTFGTYRGTTLIGGVSGRNTRTTGTAPGNGTWYQTDVPFSPSRDFLYGNAFDVYYKYFQFLETPNVAAGTTNTYRIALFNQGTYYHNRCRQNVAGGGISTLTLMEIAP
tara:strand:+ start:107 stop:706 length:600 start_codon:yes stop_codon:yes gene_type:complete